MRIVSSIYWWTLWGEGSRIVERGEFGVVAFGGQLIWWSRQSAVGKQDFAARDKRARGKNHRATFDFSDDKSIGLFFALFQARLLLHLT